MTRATMHQRAERMTAAHELLQRHPPAEAARLLAERYSLSSGQARRYPDFANSPCVSAIFVND